MLFLIRIESGDDTSDGEIVIQLWSVLKKIFRLIVMYRHELS